MAFDMLDLERRPRVEGDLRWFFELFSGLALKSSR